MTLNRIMTGLAVVMIIIAGGVWYRILRPAGPTAAPLIYSSETYAVRCPPGAVAGCVFIPGAIITWTSHLNVPKKTVLTTNISVWNDTCNRPAATGNYLTEGRLQADPTTNLAITNHYTIPLTFAPGRYHVSRFTNGTGTGEVIYQVPFVVAGAVPPC